MICLSLKRINETAPLKHGDELHPDPEPPWLMITEPPGLYCDPPGLYCDPPGLFCDPPGLYCDPPGI